ncbi:MAG TPA: NUDIX hydrolase [Anaerolineae bacterium]
MESSRIVWQGPSWRLRVETMSFPDGSTPERGVIEHPGAVVMVPLRETGDVAEVLMLRQYRHVLDEVVLELPAGTRGWDEEWLACAQRELREETGYRAQTFTPLGEIWPAPGMLNEVMALYLAAELSPDPLPADLDEALEVWPMPLVELVAMAQDGRLQDAKSIVGILRAALHLKNRT